MDDLILWNPGDKGFFSIKSLKLLLLSLNPNWCVLCKRENETMEHLFITYTYTRQVWRNFYNFVDGTTLSPSSIAEALHSFSFLKPTSKGRILLQNLIGATLWTVWLEMNNRTFHDGGKMQRQIWEDILNLSALWCKTPSVYL